SAKNILERRPTSVQDQWVLSMSQRDLAQILGGHPKMVHEAEALDRQSLALLEKLAADNPAIPNCHVEAGHTFRHLGGLLRATGRDAEATSAFHKAREYFDKLTRDFPEQSHYWLWLGDTDRELGDAQAALGQWDKALADYAKAIELNPGASGALAEQLKA